MIRSFFRKFISLDYSVFLKTGLLFLILGLFSILFLKLNNLTSFIDWVRGHTVSQIGLDRINQICLLPFKIILLGFGFLFILIASWLRFPKWLNIIYDFIKYLSLKIKKVKPYQFLLFLFAANFILRIFLMLRTSELFLAHDATDYIGIARNLFFGEGLVSRVVFFLGIGSLPEAIPYSISLCPPLFPILIFLSFKIFGISFFSAGIVNVLLGSLLPILLYIIVWQITKSKKTALLAAVLLSVSRILIGWSTQILTEIPYTFFVLLSFVFLTKKNKCWNLGLTGLFLGLAFLVRYQAIVLLGPVICLYLFLKSGFKKSLPQIFLVGLVALVIVSPWLIRNYQVFGTPFYIQNATVGGYQEFNTWSRNIGEYKSFSTAAKEDFVGVVRSVFYKFSVALISTPIKIMGGLFVFIFAIYGLWNTFKNQRKKYLSLYTYIGLYYLFFSLTKPHSRYFYVLIPFFILFAAIGFWALIKLLNQKRIFQPKFLIIKKIIIILFVLSGLAGLIFGSLSATGFTQDEKMHAIAAKETSYYFKNHSINAKTAIVDGMHPGYYNYFSPTNNIIIFPLNKEDFLYLIKKYNINYIVLPRFPKVVKGEFENYAIVDEIVGDYKNKELVYEKEDLNFKLKIYKIISF